MVAGVANDRGGSGGKDWGGSETHDWGVPPPPEASPTRWDFPNPPATAEDPAVDATPENPIGGADAVIPRAVITAMTNWKHSSTSKEPDDPGPTEYSLGSGDAALYAVDDGNEHRMIARAVGRDDDGCIYCLVARITLDRFRQLRDGAAAAEGAFDDARDYSLSSVFVDDQATNVVLVQHYDRIEDVPVEYRPPSPFYLFTDE